jgi:transglutaminase-like putative cysteine protease
VYHYHDDATLSHSLTHLCARSGPGQTPLRGELVLNVPTAVRSSSLDYFGNPVTYFSIQEAHRELCVIAINEVRVHPEAPPDPAATVAWEEAVALTRLCADARSRDAYQFVFDSPNVRTDPGLWSFAEPSFPPGRPVLEGVLDLARRIHLGFAFDPTATTVTTPLLEVLTLRRGVCQDFAHLTIGALRSFGIAARYVSGYLRTLPPAGRARLVGADVSHAWVSVYCPPFGWVDVDPTNDLIPGPEHVTLSWGRDYDDVSPIKGVILGGGKHTLTVSVDVTPTEDWA